MRGLCKYVLHIHTRSDRYTLFYKLQLLFSCLAGYGWRVYHLCFAAENDTFANRFRLSRDFCWLKTIKVRLRQKFRSHKFMTAEKCEVEENSELHESNNFIIFNINFIATNCIFAKNITKKLRVCNLNCRESVKTKMSCCIYK